MNQTIQQKLLGLEQAENIKILYACESGSRAWGFASPDSDYDVRFFYVRPLDHYLSITNMPDFLDFPLNDELDLRGWDIQKALKLFLKSNSSPYEWLQSPVVYMEATGFANELRALMPGYFSPKAMANHYASLAFNALTDDLQGDEMNLKRLFYALRSALACLWIVDRQSVPPMEFAKLRVIITDDAVQQAIEPLLEQKRNAVEKAAVKSVPVLKQWLTETLSYCKARIAELPSEKKQTDKLNALFRKYVHR
ncbi:nucleotidyltransferase domain-containing protein [Mucilaginibacter sp. CAU 1740]|uniref:nucleotidyltransferase domain-containing protein n=1 Tax=Mucilaginibacter sp. CAU 1740 TaxID=3140365 RepID=UPI00325B0CE5